MLDVVVGDVAVLIVVGLAGALGAEEFLGGHLVVGVGGGADAAGQTPRVVADQLGHAQVSTTQNHYFGCRIANPAAASALDAWHAQDESHG